MRPLLRLLFGSPDSPIDRRTYLTLGASLMAFKYIVDAVAIAIAAGVFWTPVDYLLPMILLALTLRARSGVPPPALSPASSRSRLG